MTQIATATITTSALPAGFFAKWADMATWPEWNTDTAWVRLDTPFVEGATGKLKPKGGPAVKFVVTRLVPEQEFVDVSKLLGARLEFAHKVTRIDGMTTVDVTIDISGPLGWLWTKILGKDLAASAQPDLNNLLAAVEASPETTETQH